MEVAQELPIKCEKDKKISDKETNSGSIQFKGNQMWTDNNTRFI